MNDSGYVEGPPCNLVLHDSAVEDRGKYKVNNDDIDMNNFSDNMLNSVKALMSKMTQAERMKFSSLSQMDQMNEVKRLIRKYGV